MKRQSGSKKILGYQNHLQKKARLKLTGRFLKDRERTAENIIIVISAEPSSYFADPSLDNISLKGFKYILHSGSILRLNKKGE